MNITPDQLSIAGGIAILGAGLACFAVVMIQRRRWPEPVADDIPPQEVADTKVAEKRAGRFKKFRTEFRVREALEKRFEDCIVQAELGWSDDHMLIGIAVPTFKTHRAAVLRTMARLGYRQTGEPEFSKWSGTQLYFLGRIRLTMTSKVCKRVKVRTERRMVDEDIYETECE